MGALDAPPLRQVGGIELELRELGDGRPLLFLHPETGLYGHGPVLDLLAERRRVLVPSHPGFGRSSLPDWVDEVDDVVYTYLDLLDELGLEDVALVGSSLGGWIACELALRSPRVGALALVGSLGIRVGGPEDRDIHDVFASSPAELARLAFHDEAAGARFFDYPARTDEELAITARDQEAAVLYGWEPYFCDPKLRRRLRRVAAPTLVLWGASDRIAAPDYGRALADAIPGARFELVERAGHFPQLERPDAVAAAVLSFLEA